ncbi:MAG: hypothetical protein U0736_24650 [Gemmataceae bacterium]
MASSFQQQVQQRKLLYTGLILVLFTLSWGWRRYFVDDLAGRLAIREQSRGEVELVGSVVRLGLTGSRGLVTCILWNQAIDKQKKNQWNELEVLVRSLTKLQPHFITPWLFQSWNLAYNVSVESDRVRDKYFYVTRGVELLAEGERQNRNHPDLRWSIGYYLQHKIGLSDETNYQRSLFQLSLIPPNERDPARFWRQTDSGPELNWVEFETFCRDHPQLVRRLREGMQRDTASAKRRQFSCERPEDVVQFLEDNYTLPSLYQVDPPPLDVPAQSRPWLASKKDTLLPVETRFPVLPPQRTGMFDRDALTDAATLGDDTDVHGASHAWYCYAQEALPSPGALPGSSEPITDPARQRRPKYMTTLIFRNYPAQARRYSAERLQQEGWFLDEGWDCTDWFQDSKDAALAGKQVRVGTGAEWSQRAWQRAFRAWQSHGKENHLLFDGESEEQNMISLAERYTRKLGLQVGSSVPDQAEELLSPEEREEYRAAKFMFEYSFYRGVSNFPHHYNRALVEQKPETVTCRRAFFQAAQLDLAGSPRAALDLYRTPIEAKAWPGKRLSPLDAWKELVLFPNKEYRRDNTNQEQTAEIQIRYLRLYNRFDGRRLKEDLSRAAVVVPLLPALRPETVPAPLIPGPFDVLDPDGQPLMELANYNAQASRMNVTPRPMPGGGPPSPAPPLPGKQ